MSGLFGFPVSGNSLTSRCGRVTFESPDFILTLSVALIKISFSGILDTIFRNIDASKQVAPSSKTSTSINSSIDKFMLLPKIDNLLLTVLSRTHDRISIVVFFAVALDTFLRADTISFLFTLIFIYTSNKISPA